MKDKKLREFLLGSGIIGKTPGGPADKLAQTLEDGDEGLYVRVNLQQAFEEVNERIRRMEKAMNIIMKALKDK